MKILAIAMHDLRRVLRSRAAFFWIFVGPLLFTAFFGILMRPQPARVVTVDLVSRDDGDYVARALGRALAADDVVTRVAPDVVQGRWAIEIPPKSASDLAAGRPVKLVLHSPSEEETFAERRMVFKAEKALLAVFLQANPSDVPAAESDDGIGRRLAASRAITVERADLGVVRREITGGFQRSIPAYLVMFVFMNLLISGATLAEERAGGRLRRLFLAPLTRTEIVLGKLLGRVAVGWIQIAYMLALGVFLFKIRWAAHTWVFLGFLSLFAVAAASAGLAMGTLFRDPDKCRTAAVWSVILLSPLGGLWWPLEVVGPTMRKIGYFVPTGWAMEAVNGMLAFGTGAREVAPFAAAFAAMSVALLVVVAKRLKP